MRHPSPGRLWVTPYASTLDILLKRRVVGREGFEPSKAMPADLQSAPVDRLGTDP